MQKAFFHSDKVNAFFTNRHGGVSKAPFGSFNLAFHVGDKYEDVIENHKILSQKLGIKKIAWMNQVHSDNIKITDRSGQFLDTDALITDKKGLAILVMVADCVPIIYFDPTNLVIAGVHAGREGSFLEIASKTILRMKKEFDTSPEETLVSLGPSIKSCCYKVDKNIVSNFSNKFGSDYVLKKGYKNESKYFLDLPKLNVDQLLKLGIKKENIEVSEICTCCDKNYFSYRRDNETGRFGGVVCLI